MSVWIVFHAVRQCLRDRALPAAPRQRQHGVKDGIFPYLHFSSFHDVSEITSRLSYILPILIAKDFYFSLFLTHWFPYFLCVHWTKLSCASHYLR